MAYIKHNWQLNTFQKGDAEIIKNLNQMEDGIEQGGGGGTSYTAGDGISISNNVISVDTTVAKRSEVATEATARSSADITLQANIDTKQNIISDLATIREGAAKGATAIQEHQDISGKADLPSELPPELKVPGVDHPWFMVNMNPTGIDANGNLHLDHSGYNFNLKQYYTWSDKTIPMAATETTGGVMTAADKVKLNSAITEHQDISGKLNILPKVDDPEDPGFGWEYHIPYNFETVAEPGKLKVILKTLTLDNKVTKMDFEKVLPGATTEAAGLMTASDKLSLANKQDMLTAGANIKIDDDNTLSAEAQQLELEGTSGVLTAEQRAFLENKSVVIVRDNKIHKLSSVVNTSSGKLRTYDLAIDDNVTPMYHFILVNMLTGTWDSHSTELQDKLTAGENITISADNVISAASGTTVVANPTLAGTEAELVGLQVGDTKYAIPTNRSFPSTWPIEGTCAEFLNAVAADTSAIVGRTYQGGIKFSDLYDDLSLYNAEAEVEIISSTLSTNAKVIRLNVYSATNEPYSWARMYWWTGSSAIIKPWQITARAANQYTEPYYTGTCNKDTGAITLGTTLSKGVYIVNIYGLQSTSQISYTYYFAYGGYQDWMTYSTDSCGTNVSALSGSLTMRKNDSSPLGWDSDATVDIYKMR